MDFIKNFFIFLFFLFLVGLAVFLGYAGFLPGMAAVFNADKPVDLGIAFDKGDSETVNEKIKVKFEDFTKGLIPREGVGSIGSHPVSAVFTFEELTSLFNEKTFVYYPFSDIQIKINKDDSIEVSGILLTDRIKNFIQATGGSEKTLPGLIKLSGILPLKLPFYFQGSLKVAENKVDLNIESAKVGKFSITKKMIIENNQLLEVFLENRINFLEGFYIYSLSFSDEYMEFSGKLPDQIIF